MCLEHRELRMTGPGELGRKWFREYGCWRDGGREVVRVFDVEDLISQLLFPVLKRF